jgi:hypothetical protein
MHFRHVEVVDHRGLWTVQTVAYWYTFEVSQDDETEIISYHWHPTASGGITFPHLHLGPAATPRYEPLVTAHVPTGRVDLEDVLRFAIQDLGVQPRRADWDAILALSVGSTP